MENKVKNVLSGIGFYGTLAVCLLVVGTGRTRCPSRR